MTDTASDKWLPTVVLRHDAPDGTHHFDWLIAKRLHLPDPDERALLAFRCPEVPGERDAIDAERIRDHRVVYLSHEGTISGGRGSVERVCDGRCRVLSISDRAFTLALSLWENALIAEGRLQSHSSDSEWWRIAFRPADPPA